MDSSVITPGPHPGRRPGTYSAARIGTRARDGAAGVREDEASARRFNDRRLLFSGHARSGEGLRKKRACSPNALAMN